MPVNKMSVKKRSIQKVQGITALLANTWMSLVGFWSRQRQHDRSHVNKRQRGLNRDGE